MKTYLWRALQVAVILYLILVVGIDDMLLELRH